MPKRGYVCILSSRRNGTLYIGVTSNLIRRVAQHKSGEIDGFTKRYAITRLVYFEVFDDIRDAIIREKRLKKWNRLWKTRMIEAVNPRWLDLFDDLERNPNMNLVGPRSPLPMVTEMHDRRKADSPHGSPPARE